MKEEEHEAELANNLEALVYETELFL